MKNRGITLIALVITIIVLLILAAVTLNIVLGENGIFAKARTSKNTYEYSSAKETLNLKLLEIQTDCIEKNQDYTLEIIANKLGETTEKTIEIIYYYGLTAQVNSNANAKPASIDGIVVIVNPYTQYKFLIGEKQDRELGIKGIALTKDNIQNQNEFIEIEQFESEQLQYANAIDENNPIIYNINYEGTQDATFESPKTRYTSNDATFKLKTPSKIGYIFMGWTGTDLEQVSKEVYINKGSKGDRTYTAIWGEINSANLGYVSNNLVFHLDGIYNAKTMHSSNTNTWMDISENNINATINNGCTIIDNGLNMNNSNTGYIELDDNRIINALNSQNGFTISFLADISKKTDNYQQLVHCGWTGNYEEGNFTVDLIIYPNDDILRFGFYNYDSRISFSNYYNKKILIDAVYKNGHRKIYINGSLVKDDEADQTTISENSIFGIGTYISEGGRLDREINGKVYAVKLYSRGLTDSEISSNYQLDSQRYNIN